MRKYDAMALIPVASVIVGALMGSRAHSWWWGLGTVLGAVAGLISGALVLFLILLAIAGRGFE